MNYIFLIFILFTFFKTATFNAAGTQRAVTPKDTETRADVFAFRPATSHVDLRRERQQLAADHLGQAGMKKSITEQEEERRKQREREERRALEAALDARNKEDMAYKMQVCNRDTQRERERERERERDIEQTLLLLIPFQRLAINTKRILMDSVCPR